jgi:hypothetical protein
MLVSINDPVPLHFVILGVIEMDFQLLALSRLSVRLFGCNIWRTAEGL